VGEHLKTMQVRENLLYFTKCSQMQFIQAITILEIAIVKVDLDFLE